MNTPVMLAVVLVLACLVAIGQAEKKCIHIRGHVTCGPPRSRKLPQKWVHMTLKDLTQRSPTPAVDDILDDGYASLHSGQFTLKGCMEESSSNRLDPYLIIQHDCTGQKEQWMHTIPDQYIGGRGVYEMGEVSLLNPDFRKFPTRTPFTGNIVGTCSK